MTAFVSEKCSFDSPTERRKHNARTPGFQSEAVPPTENDQRLFCLAFNSQEAGKVHSFIHACDLRTVAIEHLGLDAIGIKQ